MYSLVIKPRALQMMKDAFEWYEAQKAGLGEEFLEELDKTYFRLSQHPTYFGKIKDNFRQAALKRFPFVAVYEIIGSEVVAFAVFHTSRNPRFKFRD